jgi:hypothetical protein
MATYAGWLAAELAGVNADAHFDCERSTVLRRDGRAMPAREQGVFVGTPHVTRRLRPCEVTRAFEATSRAVRSQIAIAYQLLERGCAGCPGRRDRSSSPASPTTSGSAPRFETTTGTPADIAFERGYPNPSSNDGSTNT